MAVSDAAHPTGQCAQISRNVSTNTQKFTLLEYTMHGVHARSQQNYKNTKKKYFFDVKLNLKQMMLMMVVDASQ